MELRHIEYFTAVIELKSFSLAAQKCFVTQPTITMAIKSLENEIGLPLIDRSQRGIKMTEAGEMFYDCAKNVLGELENGLLQLENLKHRLSKNISIGVAVRSCSKLLPPLLENLADLKKDFEVEIREMISPDICEGVINGSLDYGLCILPKIINPPLGARTLMEGCIKVLMSARHPLAAMEPSVPLEALSNEKIFVYRSNDSKKMGMTEILFEEAIKKKGLEHSDIISMADSYTLMCMVAAGKCVCLMPDTSSQYMLMLPETVLKSIEFDDDSNCFQVGLVYNKKSSDPKITKKLSSYFKSIV